MKTPKQFRRVEQSWDEFWAEFWRIRLIDGDETVAWKNEQVVEFCWQVLKLKSGMSVLDLGCGGGYQAVLLAQRGVKVHGIDVSAKLAAHGTKLAKQMKVPATFAAGDMRKLSYHEQFDRVVVLGMSFGFGSEEENVHTAERIFRAVKPGGMVLLTGMHPYSASTHAGPDWMETNEGLLIHRGEFDPLTSRLGGMWELVRPDGTIITEGDNPEQDGIRCYSAPEIKRIVTEAGFRRPACYGSWMLPPADLQWFSSELITVAEKPAKRRSS
ncbi:class I SAM-dependent methyltransferase [candidate division KSB1 bacterium]|nr:class I SAM-dependent methyltransferase [candidate division KSB1 bacterium]